MHKRLRMTFLLVIWLAFSFGCAQREKGTWANLGKLRSLDSVKSISDYFQRIDFATKIKTLDIAKTKWCFVTVYPYSGVGRMDIVCFSGSGTFWSLDTILTVMHSDSPEVG